VREKHILSEAAVLVRLSGLEPNSSQAVSSFYLPKQLYTRKLLFASALSGINAESDY
jgi:hypothetical protein